jgi:two-component system chemotaxis response regulator CheB
VELRPGKRREQNKEIVVIGASAGGVPVLKEVVAALPADLNAAVLVVLHVAPSDPSYLAEILQRHTRMPVRQAENREAIRRGHIYVARPDYHLILEEDTVRLARGPKENRVRPAIDALFRSAANSYGSAVIAVVLSGTLDDGSAGLWWVKERGGTAVVQDPKEAEFSAMPRNALLHVEADHVVKSAAIGPLLARLTAERVDPREKPVSNNLKIETEIARDGEALRAGVMNLGPLTPYTCPDCHGVLVQTTEGGVPRFRCHTGHAFSINTLLAGVTEYVEDSLWNSIRAIEESAMLLNQLARSKREEVGGEEFAVLFEQKAKDTMKRSDLLRKAAHEHQTLSQDNITEVESGAR